MGLAQTVYTLQTIIFPTEDRADRLSLYATSWEKRISLAKDSTLSIAPDCGVSLMSFFNALSFRKWRALTAIDEVFLCVRGSGEIDVAATIWTSTGAGWDIVSERLQLTPEGVLLKIPRLSTLSGEVVSVRFRGTGLPATIGGASWVTTEAPKRDVNLAAVITTFGREAAARKAMASFSSTTCTTSPLGTVELYVVDNERKLGSSEQENVTVFANPNLGGAGGFARGLSEALKANKFTHVLFMDDDAACEPESVWRTMALLSYATDDRCAVAGAMLMADNPTLQYEKGGIFNKTAPPHRTWDAEFHNRNLSDVAAVCSNDSEDRANYGGWWFFAFPLSHVRFMPFPFFVRGDDTDFSLCNDFKIATLNGVATWCDNFGYKLSPVTQYLACRSWMALALQHGNRKRAQETFRETIRNALLLGYRFDYAGMNAVLDGLEDAMRGPEFFRDMPAPMERLKSLRASGVQQPLGREEFDALSDVRKLRRRNWFVRRLSRWGGGHLLPSRMRQGVVRHARIAWDFGRGGLRAAHRGVVGTGTNLEILTFNRAAFFAAFLRAKRLSWTLRSKIPEVQSRYKNETSSIRTLDYWEPLFRDQGVNKG